MAGSFREWIEDRLVHLVTVSIPTGRDAYGDEVFLADVDMFARIEPLAEYRISIDGADVIISADAWFELEAPILVGARVVWGEFTYIVVKGGPMPGIDGAHTHQEWVLQ